MTRLLPVLLFACGSSHVSPSDDAGREPETFDAGTTDADATDAPDAGIDAGPSLLRRCELTQDPPLELFGDGCFCRGPLVARGGHLYRQSIGIEVFRIRDGLPVRVGSVDERPSSQGGLAVAGDHLVSVIDHAPELRIYSLAEPAAPALVATVPLEDASTSRLAGTENLVLLARSDFVQSTLQLVDLTDPAAPRVRWSLELEGDATSLALSERGVFALEDRGDPAARVTWLVWRETDGALRDEVRLGVARPSREIALHGADVLVSGSPDSPLLLSRFRTAEDGLSLRDSIESGLDFASAGGPILVRGDLALVSRPATVVQLGEELRRLERGGETSLGAAYLVGPPGAFQWVYGSHGNGISAIEVGCE